MAPFRAQSARTLATHVCVGVGAASFWRGAWYVLDDHLFPEDAVKSASASMVLGVAGLTASQGLVERAERLAKKASIGGKVRPTSLAIARFGAIYSVATSCVLVWRATWLGWDILYESLHPAEDTKSTDPGHMTHSGIFSHVASLTLLLGTGLFASVLAPPAAISVIRDHTVRSGPQYIAPAQTLVNQIFRSNGNTVRGFANKSTPSSSSSSFGAAATSSAPRSAHSQRALRYGTTYTTSTAGTRIATWK